MHLRPPTFVVIGAQRAGTTSLFEHLRSHPDIFIPPIKELSFFVDGARWRQGLGWYESQFAAAGAARHLGDVSPGYTMFPVGTNAAEHLAALAPAARLIYSIRHPLERIESAYWMLRSQGLEPRGIDEALRNDLRYLAPSMYGLQLGRFLDRFPRSQVLVVVFEEMRQEPAPTFDRVLEFLDLAPGWRPPTLDQAHNSQDAWPREPSHAALLALRFARRHGFRRWRPRDLVRWRLTSKALRRTERIDPETLRALSELILPDLHVLCERLGWSNDPWGMLGDGPEQRPWERPPAEAG